MRQNLCRLNRSAVSCPAPDSVIEELVGVIKVDVHDLERDQDVQSLGEYLLQAGLPVIDDFARHALVRTATALHQIIASCDESFQRREHGFALVEQLLPRTR